MQAWSLDDFILLILIAVAVCSCWTQALSLECRPGRLKASLVVGSFLISNDVDRWGRLFLLDAGLVVGMQAWSLDYLIFNDFDRWARLLLQLSLIHI